MTVPPTVGTGEMVVTFDQDLKESQLPIDRLHYLNTMRSDTITLTTEGTEATDDEVCSSTSARSSDENGSVHSDTLEEEEVKVVELEAMPPQEESSAAKDDSKPVTTKRRTSILKQYNAADIPVRDKRCYWKQLPKPNLEKIRANSVPAICISDVTCDALENCRTSGGVRFHVIQVREYEQTMGDNPSVSYGPPISLDWDYEELEPVDLEVYEATRGPRRTMRQMMLNYYNRRNILTWRCGFSEEELKVAKHEANKIKRARAMTKALLPAQLFEEVMQSAARKTKRFTQRRQPATV
jgi:hypothetical protein